MLCTDSTTSAQKSKDKLKSPSDLICRQSQKLHHEQALKGPFIIDLVVEDLESTPRKAHQAKIPLDKAKAENKATTNSNSAEKLKSTTLELINDQILKEQTKDYHQAS
jgi:hypothetical protein